MMPSPDCWGIVMAIAGPQSAGGASAPLALDASKEFTNNHRRLSKQGVRHAQTA